MINEENRKKIIIILHAKLSGHNFNNLILQTTDVLLHSSVFTIGRGQGRGRIDIRE